MQCKITLYGEDEFGFVEDLPTRDDASKKYSGYMANNAIVQIPIGPAIHVVRFASIYRVSVE